MKKFFISLLALAIIGNAGNLFAAGDARGGAVIPHVLYRNVSASERMVPAYFISNITAATITVRIRFYDKAGALITDDGVATSGTIRGTNVSSYDDNITGTPASVEFDLGANDTGFIQLLGTSTTDYGYAVIDWEQLDSDVTVGLVAHGYVDSIISADTTYWRYAIPINGGLPF